MQSKDTRAAIETTHYFTQVSIWYTIYNYVIDSLEKEKSSRSSCQSNRAVPWTMACSHNTTLSILSLRDWCRTLIRRVCPTWTLSSIQNETNQIGEPLSHLQEGVQFIVLFFPIRERWLAVVLTDYPFSPWQLSLWTLDCHDSLRDVWGGSRAQP